MNNTKYLKQMITLTHELERAASAEPYDPDAYNDVIDRLNNLKSSLEQRRRRRPWSALISIIILLIILLVVLYVILRGLYV